MFVDKRKRLYNYILLVVLVLGMCFEHVTSESMETGMLTCESDVFIGKINYEHCTRQACAPRLFQVRNVEDSHRFAGAEYGHRNQLRLMFEAYQPINDLLKRIVLLFCSLVVILKGAGSTERIAFFVHRADGKKRICSA